MADELLVKCRYGWRQVVQLYRDYLEINATRYNLADLIYVLPTCRRVLGKSSLRLELCFKEQVVVLRGISNLDAAQEMVHYLQSRCSAFVMREPDVRGISPLGALSELPITEGGNLITQWDTSEMSIVQMPTTPLAVPVQQVPTVSKQRQEYIEQEDSAVDVEEKQSQGEENEGDLPCISVPLRLLEGENAHCCTPATWCDEALDGSSTSQYRVKDHGTLILTNLRIIYLGRKSQVILRCADLVQVAHRQGALVFLTRQSSRSQIFTVSSLEYVKHLEHVLYSLEQPSQIVEETIRPVLANGSYQYIVAHDGQEQPDREMLADEDTQEITSVADQKGSFAGYEQHMEWLEQLGITYLFP